MSQFIKCIENNIPVLNIFMYRFTTEFYNLIILTLLALNIIVNRMYENLKFKLLQKNLSLSILLYFQLSNWSSEIPHNLDSMSENGITFLK